MWRFQAAPNTDSDGSSSPALGVTDLKSAQVVPGSAGFEMSSIGFPGDYSQSNTLSLELEPEDRDRWPALKMVGTIVRHSETPCSAAVNSGSGRYINEEVLALDVNGLSAGLLTFGCSRNGFRADSTGWIEGYVEFGSEFDAMGREVVEFDYTGYLISGAASEEDDVLRVTLETSDEYTVVFERIESGYSVVPGSTTTLEIVDRSVEIGTEADATVSLIFRLESDRAKSAFVDVRPLSNGRFESPLPVELEIVNGEATGGIDFVATPVGGEVSGVLVADTEFNDPASQFTIAISAGSDNLVDIARNVILLWAAVYGILGGLLLVWWRSPRRRWVFISAIIVTLVAPVVSRFYQHFVLDRSMGDAPVFFLISLGLVMVAWMLIFFVPSVLIVRRLGTWPIFGIALAAALLATVVAVSPLNSSDSFSVVVAAYPVAGVVSYLLLVRVEGQINA